MKKRTLFLLSLVMVMSMFLFAACGPDNGGKADALKSASEIQSAFKQYSVTLTSGGKTIVFERDGTTYKHSDGTDTYITQRIDDFTWTYTVTSDNKKKWAEGKDASSLVNTALDTYMTAYTADAASLTKGDSATVAGQTTTKYTLNSKTFYVDNTTGACLKVEGGSAAENFEVTAIKFSGATVSVPMEEVAISSGTTWNDGKRFGETVAAPVGLTITSVDEFSNRIEIVGTGGSTGMIETYAEYLFENTDFKADANCADHTDVAIFKSASISANGTLLETWIKSPISFEIVMKLETNGTIKMVFYKGSSNFVIKF